MSFEKEILHLIPQGPPFVMIGKLLHADEKLTITSFLIAEDNIFVEGGKFKEPGLIENIAQTGAVGLGYISAMNNKPVSIGYIGAVKNLEIFALPNINDELITEITIENQVFDVTIISGRSWCNKVLLAQCEMKIFISGENATFH